MLLLNPMLCLLSLILLLLLAMQTHKAAGARKIVSRLLIDDMYYYDTRNTLLCRGVEPTLEMVFSVPRLPHSAVLKQLQKNAWRTACKTNRQRPFSMKLTRKMTGDDLLRRMSVL